MPSLVESKVEADVTFLGEDLREVSGPHPATVHLFEHHYDPETPFWHGVALVACSFPELDRAARAAGLPDPGPGFMHNPAEFSLRLELPDGRWGLARHWASRWEFGDRGEYARVAFVCDTALAPKREGPADMASDPA